MEQFVRGVLGCAAGQQELLKLYNHMFYYMIKGQQGEDIIGF